MVKKSLLFFATILLSLGFFAGCSDLDNDSKEASSASGGEKFCLVSGNLVLKSESGATSSSLLSSVSSKAAFASSDSRSATSSLTEYTSTLELWGELYVSAKKEGNDEVEGTITSNEDGSVSYSLKLPAPGEWTVTARQDAQEYNNGVIIIMKGSTSLIVDDEYSAITEDITLVPDGFLSQITGEIKLAIFDNTADKKVSSLTFYCDKLLNAESNENSLSKDSLGENGTIAFVDGKAEINLSKVMANCYEVTFLFNDKGGNTLYRCKEALTVYSGFVTDSWFGESSYIKKNGENGYQFSITDDLITKFGAEIVPESNIMLYDVSSSGNYSYYQVTDVTTSNLANNYVAECSISGSTNFTFDSKGHVYTITSGGLYSSSLPSSTPTASIEGTISPMGISCDRKSDNLYILAVDYDAQGNRIFYMYEVPAGDNFTSSLVIASLKCYKFTLNFTNGITSVPYAFTVHDNKFYAPCLDSESNSFFIEADISKAVIDDKTGKYIITLGDSNLVNLNESFPSDVGFTDILYQDGYVYTLFKTEAYHLGTVIRYNTFSSSATMLEIPTPAKLEGKAQVFVMSNEQHVDLYSDESSKNPVMCVYTKLFSNIYAPSTDADLSSYLCGPVRFLAIKPKKLVIADDGIAFFTDDSGNLSYKNINRVVYVDLETFSIESVSETNAKFDADRESYESDSLSGADWNNQFSILGLPASVYGKKNGSNFTITNSVDPGSTYFHLEIPCAD
ncbi:hypothetical protein [Treponema sp.]|uniref:hypothetical protein n=1 Tax=Treponema sp. TaxID=166 RepID=UPI0025DEF7B7|nr:hypothetical protein [Treponema sp.]MBR4321249.1 hypothetical protein [Treponema sp.]